MPGAAQPQRLQKIIAAAGITSRRKAEDLITSGRVTVNGKPVTELGAKADPATDRISVNGRPLHRPEQHVYFMLNKPRGYVSTVADPQHRPTVLDLVRPAFGKNPGLHGAPGGMPRLYPVGRLDYNSEGLLLLTNDGDFAQQMMHAAFHLPRTYLVKVSGRPSADELNKLRSGIVIGGEEGKRRHQPAKPTASNMRNPRSNSLRTQPEDHASGRDYHRRAMKPVKTAPARVSVVRDAPNPWLEVTLTEGRNRQIHRMFERIGHFVEKIKRVKLGSLELDIEPGRFRPLTYAELRSLRQVAASRKPSPRQGR